MNESLDILIIDDDPEILKAVTILLKHRGHRPMTTAAEDTAVIVELRKGNYLPDIIIMDILLSGIDGRDLCRELKNEPKTRNIPIIMFSAYPNIEGSAKAAGADYFLAKPFGWRDLNNAIAEVMAVKQIR
jgi:CheY-like chemotaxis protein